MAQDQADSPAAEESPQAPSPSDRGWFDAWQFPALLAGSLLLVLSGILLKDRAPDYDFDRALQQVEDAIYTSHEYAEALVALNDEIIPRFSTDLSTPEQRALAHYYRGDAVAMLNQSAGVEHRENYTKLLNEYESGSAELLAGGEDPSAFMTAERLAFAAEALLGLNRKAEALERIEQIPAEHAQARVSLLRRIAERALGAPDGREQAVLLLQDLAAESGASPSDQVWVAARQAELRLADGYTEEALTHLLRAMHRFEGFDGVGELHYLLGRMYAELGRFDSALERLDAAARLLPESDLLVGDVLWLRGHIMQQRDPVAANDAYASAVTEYPSASMAARSFTGLAELAAADGSVDDAIAWYRRGLGEFGAGASPPGFTEGDLEGSVLDRRLERLEIGDWAGALRFAELAAKGRPSEQVSRRAILAFAESLQLSAERRLTPTADGASVDDPVTRAEVRQEYAESAVQYLAYAQRALRLDPAAYADALWRAGECYDRANEPEQAIKVFSEYAQGNPEDPRQPEAVLRIAQAHHAMGEYGVAIQFYRQLLREHPNSHLAAGCTGSLARSLLALDTAGASAEAEQKLYGLLRSGVIDPGAAEYRQTLVDLANLYLRTARPSEALSRFSEALDRYPNDPDRILWRYNRAEAERMVAGDIGARAQAPAPRAVQAELSALRQRRLEESRDNYAQVIALLDGLPRARLGQGDAERLRHAHFHLADCEYKLGRYDTAIERYDQAARRYSERPGSLLALMQIVTCYLDLGQVHEARIAHHRAQGFYDRIPAERFDDPSSPITQSHWERWFRSKERLVEIAESATMNASTEGSRE